MGICKPSQHIWVSILYVKLRHPGPLAKTQRCVTDSYMNINYVTLIMTIWGEGGAYVGPGTHLYKSVMEMCFLHTETLREWGRDLLWWYHSVLASVLTTLFSKPDTVMCAVWLNIAIQACEPSSQPSQNVAFSHPPSLFNILRCMFFSQHIWVISMVRLYFKQ